MLSPLSIFGLLREFNIPSALNHANNRENRDIQKAFYFKSNSAHWKNYALSAKRSWKNLCSIIHIFFYNLSIQSDHCEW